MCFRSAKKAMLAMAGLTGAAVLWLLLCLAPKSQYPVGELSLAHFREVTIPFTQSTFGVREWRYAGDLAAGGRPQSFTDFWCGSLEVSTRLPASVAAVPLCLAGVGVFGLLVLGTWRGLHRARD
jgi:hypothetical protein